MHSSSIKIMSLALASQIAAGEVIERPASVLKELLENSLDADSQHIEVRILQSGIQQIYVKDDGKGIPANELHLACLPHATSKISAFSELETLSSYGFRGEALASIAAVAKLQLSSRIADSDLGAHLIWDFAAQSPTVVPIPHAVGTTVDVQSLFCHTPVRRKFLKSEKTEWLHLEETFKRNALGAPQVGFSLFHQGKRLYHLTPAKTEATWLQRVRTLCGQRFVDRSRHVDVNVNGLQLQGWILLPNPPGLLNTKSLPTAAYFFLNGRIIKDRLINHAIKQAFLTAHPECNTLDPSYVLYLKMDPAQFDVNVHPAKQEVRFREPRRIHAFLNECLQTALNKESKFEAPMLRSEPLGFFQAAPLRMASIPKPSFKSKPQLPTFGKPRLVFKDAWVICEDEEGLSFLNVLAAHRFLNLPDISDLTFFSLKEAESLIKTLENHLKKTDFSHNDVDRFFRRVTASELNQWFAS